MVHLILHAGLTKTGSKSIQRAFAEGREALAGQGVFYPVLSDTPLPGHWQLGAFWRQEMRAETENNVMQRLDAWAPAEETPRLVRAGVIAAIARARAWERDHGAAAAVVLSDELLGYPGAQRACRQLLALAERQGVALAALAWARPDPELFVSLVQQQAKSHAHPFVYRNLRHPPQVQRLARIFGPALRLQLYDRGREAVTGFMAALGEVLGRGLESLPPRARANESIPAAGCALLIAVGQASDPKADMEGFRSLRRALMEAELGFAPLTLPEGWEARILAEGAEAWNAMLEAAGLPGTARLPEGFGPRVTEDEIRTWVTSAADPGLEAALRDWLGPAPRGWKAQALALLDRTASARA